MYNEMLACQIACMQTVKMFNCESLKMKKTRHAEMFKMLHTQMQCLFLMTTSLGRQYNIL